MAENTKRRVITTAGMREQKAEEYHGNALRPQTFDAYIGQAKVKEQVLMSVKSAMIRKEPAPHMLFYGPPGLGKTTLAHIIANAECVPVTEIAGPSVDKPGDMAAILMNVKSKGILFIDEIHRLPPPVEEVLYSAMEDDYLNITVGTGEQQKVVHVKLPPFTLIGATTRAGMLSAPLRDRFGLKCRMEFYTDEELSQIIQNSAAKIKIQLTKKNSLRIAKASRGTPRIANSLIERIRDVAVVENNGKVTDDEVDRAFSLAGINCDGLTGTDIHLLDILKDKDAPVGLQTLADMTGEDSGTIEDVYEPYLIMNGYMEKTSRGRVITEKGKNSLQSAG